MDDEEINSFGAKPFSISIFCADGKTFHPMQVPAVFT